MSDKPRRRFGDRKEGRRLRSITPLMAFTPYIMRDRNDASNYFEGEVDITETDRWLREQRRGGYKGLGMLHMFIAAYVRVVSQMPGLNRFVSGQRVYARNEIMVNMMVKYSVDPHAPETCAKVVFEPTDTIYDVYNKMNAAVEEIRSGDTSGTENAAGVLMKIPRLVQHPRIQTGVQTFLNPPVHLLTVAQNTDHKKLPAGRRRIRFRKQRFVRPFRQDFDPADQTRPVFRFAVQNTGIRFQPAQSLLKLSGAHGAQGFAFLRVRRSAPK